MNVGREAHIYRQHKRCKYRIHCMYIMFCSIFFLNYCNCFNQKYDWKKRSDECLYGAHNLACPGSCRKCDLLEVCISVVKHIEIMEQQDWSRSNTAMWDGTTTHLFRLPLAREDVIYYSLTAQLCSLYCYGKSMQFNWRNTSHPP